MRHSTRYFVLVSCIAALFGITAAGCDAPKGTQQITLPRGPVASFEVPAGMTAATRDVSGPEHQYISLTGSDTTESLAVGVDFGFGRSPMVRWFSGFEPDEIVEVEIDGRAWQMLHPERTGAKLQGENFAVVVMAHQDRITDLIRSIRFRDNWQPPGQGEVNQRSGLLAPADSTGDVGPAQTSETP